MTSYIGPLGGLVPLKCPVTQVQSAREAREKVTTSGVVRQQVARRTNREWRLDWSAATPAQIANLAALAAGEYGIGPFWFVDPWAQVTNLLAPAWSTFGHDAPTGTTMGGPVNLADGSRAGRSLVVPSPTTTVVLPRIGSAFQRVPVRNGQPVTGSVYASGAGAVQVRLSWARADGSDAGASAWTAHTPGASMRRLWAYGNPPGDAASAVINVRGANRIARPALTWSSFLADWHVGQGAPSVAIPASLSQDVILATRENRAGGRLASVSTTIREVG